MIDINIGTSDQEMLIKIRASLPILQKERYKNKFIECQKNFSWSYSNMPNLDTYFVMHSIPLKNDAKLVKQKSIKMHPSKVLLFKKEIEKYLNNIFIRPIDFS